MKLHAIRFVTVSVFTMLLGVSSAFGQANQPPVATAGADVSVVLTGTSIAVDLAATATDPEGDPIAIWAWTIDSMPLGANASFSPSSLVSNPTFFADTLGAYNLSVIACDAIRCSLPAALTITAVANQPPVAVATADVVTGAAPLTVNFDGSQSYDPEGGALIYDWIFGDGFAGATGSSTQYTYQNPGTYTVILTTIDSNGLGGEDTLLITVTSPVNNPPVASATATPNTGIAPLPVTFSANASDAEGDALTYAWDFGDAGSTDNTSASASPSHTYHTAGTFVAWVTVSDGSNSVSSSATIVVDDVVIPGLDFDVASVKLKTKKHGTKSRLQIKGTFNPLIPAPGDLITLMFDDREVFSAPFSSFVLAGWDDEDDDKDEEGLDDDQNLFKFKLKQGKTRVELDIGKGRIGVKAKRIDLAGFSGSSAVVELHIGDAVGVDTVTFESQGDDHEHKRGDHEDHH